MYEVKVIEVEVLPCSEIKSICCDMCELAQKFNCVVSFEFNGVKIFANKEINPIDLVNFYYQAIH